MEMDTGAKMEGVETEAVEGMDLERVETEAVEGMDLESVETEAVEGMDSERVETEAVEGMDSERLDTEVEVGMESRGGSRALEELNLERMGAEALAAANDFDIRLLVENLAYQVEVDSAVSEGVSALNGRHTLNLEGVFSSYLEDDRKRALAFVFRLVDGARIKCLQLQYNKIDSAALGHGLQNFKGDSLEEIDLSCNRLRGEGIAALWTVSWPNLRKLVLRNNNIEDLDCIGMAGAIQVGQLRALRSIDLSDNHIRDAGIVSLAGCFRKSFLPQLRELALDQNSFGDAGVNKIAEAISAGGLQLLQHLSLRFNMGIGVSSIVTLITSFASGQACHMNKLDFQNLRFGPNVAMELIGAMESGGLKSLKKLFLGRSWGKEDKHLIALMATLGKGHALNLQELHLTLSNSVIGELTKAIQSGNLKSLEKLGIDLSGRPVEEGGSLEHLMGILSKGHTNNLQELHLKLNSAAAVELTKELEARNLKLLTCLNLSSKGMAEASLLSLLAALSRGHTANLQELHLRGMMMSDDVSSEITHAIESGNLRSLRKLHLSKVEGGLLVSLAAASCRGHLVDLQELTLAGSGFGSEGIVELVKSIGSHSLQSLTTLEILGTWTKMWGKSLVSLATMLGKQQNVNLRRVLVNGLEWGYDGLKLGSGENNIAWEDDDVMELAGAVDLGNLNLLVNLDLGFSGSLICSPKCLVFLSAVLGKGQMVKLRELHLQQFYWHFLGDGYSELAKAIGSGSLKSLTVLDMSGSWGMTDRSVVCLAAALGRGHMVNLRELLFPKSDWQDDGFMELSNALGSGSLKSVITLDLSLNKLVTSKALVYFAAALGKGQMVNLRELFLSRMGMEETAGFVAMGWDENAIAELAKAMSSGSLKSLAVLDLSGNGKISGKSLVSIAVVLGTGHMMNLHQLLIDGIEWGIDGMKLGADGINWEDEDVIELSRAIESGSLKSVVKLDVSGSTNVTGISLVYLAAALCKGKVVDLQELHLSDIGCSDEGIMVLSEAVHSGNLQSLKMLEVSKVRNCGDTSLAALAASVGAGHLVHLESFTLKNTGLGSKGALAAANAINSGKLPSLQILNVDQNPNIDLESMLELQRTCALWDIKVLQDLTKMPTDFPGRWTVANTDMKKGMGSFPQQDSASKMLMTDHMGATSSSAIMWSPFGPNVEEDKLVKGEEGLKRGLKPHNGGHPHQEVSNTHQRSSSPTPTCDEGSEFRQYVQGDTQVKEGRAVNKGVRSKDKSHPHVEDSIANQSMDSNESNIDGAGRRSRSLLTSEVLQFRLDVQSLGLRSWDDINDQGRTLVLGDVTSSEEQLHFVFFHTKDMVRLFGCGIPFSKVTILLDQQLVWIQELTEESWKAIWMNSCSDNWRLLLFEEGKFAQQSDVQHTGTQGFQLNQRQALSQFGVSLDESSLHEFVKSSKSATAREEGNLQVDWEPVWMSWIKSVLNHVFPNGSVSHQLRGRMDALSCKHAPGTNVSRQKGKKAVVNQAAQEANTSLQHAMDRGIGLEKSSLTVIVTFNCPACPFFKYSMDRKSAEEIADDKTAVPQEISHIEPTLTVEFVRNAQEKLVTTTLEVRYQMKPSEWLHNDLRLSFRNNEAEGCQTLRSHAMTGLKSVKIDATSQKGGSKSDQQGACWEGEGQGSMYVFSAGGKRSAQNACTEETSWSEQSNFASSRTVLNSHPDFGVSSISFKREMEYRALFWPIQDPSMYCFRQSGHKYEQSGLKSELYMEAGADWELYGRGTHEYVLEASKELSKCSKAKQEVDGGGPFKRIKLLMGRSLSLASSNVQDQKLDEVIQEKILQMFTKKFFLNHDFDQFFMQYQQPSAHRWKVVEQKPEENPVPRALRDGRLISGETSARPAPS